MDSIRKKKILSAAAFIILMSKIRQKRRRKVWQRKILERRAELSLEKSLMSELLIYDAAGFQNFLRMSPHDFQFLLTVIGPEIARSDTNYRKAISINDRLGITLRFLATGDSYTSLMYLARVSKQAILVSVPEVCEALYNNLKELVTVPQTELDWLRIERGFSGVWNFSHCVGAIDGKHVVLQAPPNSGSHYYNYKGTHSIILLAAVDANYMFTYFDVGSNGRLSDGGVYVNSSLYPAITNDLLYIPKPIPLPGREVDSPYVFVADEAFPLCTNFMKPFHGSFERGSPQRIYNYRLSRARRVVENVFGIMAAKFRVFRKPIMLGPAKVRLIVSACIVLHNFLSRNTAARNTYNPPGLFDIEETDNGTVIPGLWRQDEFELPSVHGGHGRPAQDAKNVRLEFADYFLSEQGSVPWQNICA